MARTRALKAGTLVEFRYHGGHDLSDGRRARIVRQVANYAQYMVKIESCPAHWSASQCAQQVGALRGWWAHDFIIITETT